MSLAAYDQESYLFGVIFCCCIGVLPVVIATTLFFIKMFSKLKSMTAGLEDAQKNLIILKNHIFDNVSGNVPKAAA